MTEEELVEHVKDGTWIIVGRLKWKICPMTPECFDYAVDNNLWAALSPTRDEGGGLLCLNCFVRRFQEEYGRAGAEGSSFPLVVHVASVSIASSWRRSDDA